jgi:hypothetical protein
MLYRAVFFTLLFACQASAADNEIDLVISGLSYHFQDKPAEAQQAWGNDWNWFNSGIGVEYHIEPKSRDWHHFYLANFVKDSNSNWSPMTGVGYAYRQPVKNNWYADLGGTAFLMAREDWNDYQPFVGILPALTIGNGNIAINVTGAPKISPKHVGFIFIQAKFRL